MDPADHQAQEDHRDPAGPQDPADPQVGPADRHRDPADPPGQGCLPARVALHHDPADRQGPAGHHQVRQAGHRHDPAGPQVDLQVDLHRVRRHVQADRHRVPHRAHQAHLARAVPLLGRGHRRGPHQGLQVLQAPEGHHRHQRWARRQWARPARPLPVPLRSPPPARVRARHDRSLLRSWPSRRRHPPRGPARRYRRAPRRLVGRQAGRQVGRQAVRRHRREGHRPARPPPK